MTPTKDTPRGRPLSTHDQPISPSQARALHDAGVPGVPAFVALTGRPVRSRDLYPAPPAPLPIRLSR